MSRQPALEDIAHPPSQSTHKGALVQVDNRTIRLRHGRQDPEGKHTSAYNQGRCERCAKHQRCYVVEARAEKKLDMVGTAVRRGVSLDCSSSSAGFYTEYEAESRKSDERWYISVVDCHRRVDEDKLSAKEV